MSRRYPRSDHNCHGIGVDVFMAMETRMRWREVRDFMPDDYTPPPMDVLTPDDSWIALRTIQNMNDHEWELMRQNNFDFVKRFGHLRRYRAKSRHRDHGYTKSERRAQQTA